MFRVQGLGPLAWSIGPRTLHPGHDGGPRPTCAASSASAGPLLGLNMGYKAGASSAPAGPLQGARTGASSASAGLLLGLKGLGWEHHQIRWPLLGIISITWPSKGSDGSASASAGCAGPDRMVLALAGAVKPPVADDAPEAPSRASSPCWSIVEGPA